MGIDNIRNEKNRVRLEKQTVERKREEKKLARENHGREVYKRYHSALKIYESDFWDLFELFTSLVRGKIFKGRGFFLCSSCGNPSHFYGGLSPWLKDQLSTKYGLVFDPNE